MDPAKPAPCTDHCHALGYGTGTELCLLRFRRSEYRARALAYKRKETDCGALFRL